MTAAPPGPERDQTGPPSEAVPLKAVPVRHPLRWAMSAVVLVLAAMLVNTLFFSHQIRGGKVEPRYQWGIVGQYFTSAPVLRGLVVTLELTVLAMAIGIIGGVLLAIMRISSSPLLSGFSWLYIWFFRGTPVLVQLLFWFELSYNYTQLSLGVPFGPAFLHLNTNTAISSFVAAVLGLGLNEAAYMAEIVRAGLLSVDEGQSEAAQSLGMSRLMTIRRIVLPQAMRLIIPPMGNETISMLKTSSLASIVTVTEVLYAVQLISARTYQVVPLLMVASLWYLIVTSVLTIGQYYVERRYARGSARALPPTPLQRLRRNLFTVRPDALATAESPPLREVIGREH
ncbi:MAG TPA: amino acid ABC transporter permease [Acidimicrobiales bacterium]|nr:amino acid ABC transporter permease [Acidimicrobiales bacterium]